MLSGATWQLCRVHFMRNLLPTGAAGRPRADCRDCADDLFCRVAASPAARPCDANAPLDAFRMDRSASPRLCVDRYRADRPTPPSTRYRLGRRAVPPCRRAVVSSCFESETDDQFGKASILRRGLARGRRGSWLCRVAPQSAWRSAVAPEPRNTARRVSTDRSASPRLCVDRMPRRSADTFLQAISPWS